MAGVEEKLKALEIDDDNDGDVVDPWTVTSKSDTGIDYDKLTREVSCLVRVRSVRGNQQPNPGLC